ncbi:CHAD domain-containing protein [Nocardia tenerifensis]|uniref:CHAD domain-containing protein n=1 Tax=Nocardia tenerifensis TaxID=228006 RepID=A0A318KEH8_9NOCA|nr:CYTH and CHAD domain-containing protein [Nocardia tenerifensis]PXX71209.1 CHAD domain-containing protein [Nocardia tenerifensis]
MKDVLERETKWEVDREFTLPAIDDLVPGGHVEETSVELTSTYFDTAERDLLTHRLTLRRRAGDDESGWQLKVPQADGRVEVTAAWSEELPRELAEVVTGAALGRELNVVTTIHTLRNRHRVLGPDGELIIEIDDDVVQTTPVPGETDALAWREIEVELGPHTDTMPEILVERLTEAGAARSKYPSKLSRVLPPPSGPAMPGSKAERALRDYLTAQIDAIFAGDVALRRGEDPIHDTRVATRRLRSTLRVFGKLLDPAAIDGVADELKWYAGLLGEVRDCHVQRRRLADKVAELPLELVLGPVAARIDATLLERQVTRRKALAEAMDSPRYLALLAALRTWQSRPPCTIGIGKGQLVRRADRAAHKADRRLAEALRDQRDESLHRARKAAKRARYAAELYQPVRASAKANIKYYKKIQSVLGDYNDGVVSAAFLWRIATSAGTTGGENGFTYGLLYANEKHAAKDARDKITAIAGRRETD